MRRWLLLLLLIACGPVQRDSSPQQPPRDADEVDPTVGCVRHDGADPDACAAPCHLGAPLWCSGMGAPPPPDWDHQPCACICSEDELECASVQ